MMERQQSPSSPRCSPRRSRARPRGRPSRPADVLPVPESISAQGVPPIPARASSRSCPRTRTSAPPSSLDWHPKERRMLIRTRFAESPQLHEVAMPMGDAQPAHLLPRSGGRRAVPARPIPTRSSTRSTRAAPRTFSFSCSTAGPAAPAASPTAPTATSRRVWSHDGKLAGLREQRPQRPRHGRLRGRSLDARQRAAAGPGPGLLVAARLERRTTAGCWSTSSSRPTSPTSTGWTWRPARCTRSRRATRGKEDPTDLLPGRPLVGATAGRSTRRATGTASSCGWCASTSRPAAPTVLSGDVPWDVERLRPLGRRQGPGVLAQRGRRQPAAPARPRDRRKALPSPELPAGHRRRAASSGPARTRWRFALSWARSPSDVYSYDPDSRQLERWTASEAGGLNPETFPVPELVRYPTFDDGAGRRPRARSRPWSTGRPRTASRGKRPVIINIHGGPEGAVPAGLPGEQQLSAERARRGRDLSPTSAAPAGYGKTYLKLDNGKLREDSVKDIGALLDWIATQPDLDASRVMVTGGSYGGYMVARRR